MRSESTWPNKTMQKKSQLENLTSVKCLLRIGPANLPLTLGEKSLKSGLISVTCLCKICLPGLKKVSNISEPKTKEKKCTKCSRYEGQLAQLHSQSVFLKSKNPAGSLCWEIISQDSKECKGRIEQKPFLGSYNIELGCWIFKQNQG